MYLRFLRGGAESEMVRLGGLPALRTRGLGVPGICAISVAKRGSTGLRTESYGEVYVGTAGRGRAGAKCGTRCHGRRAVAGNTALIERGTGRQLESGSGQGARVLGGRRWLRDAPAMQRVKLEAGGAMGVSAAWRQRRNSPSGKPDPHHPCHSRGPVRCVRNFTPTVKTTRIGLALAYLYGRLCSGVLQILSLLSSGL